ncbi:hypothetical protein IC757_14605 [Wenzhouxiangella sp. AB-CW3]|uniref:hypothetical protein n=1 Tax=Wenzhouxiangella sp. AB-CW3 TaxID=2771012 RepID=UPI00168A6FA2|nr:hypothetical protein [Wenzhouxiangella sp. AB-CW3]QOC22231.1 hypothetical protein IC757_14605 [Wenzhouxiangella sp. AB-CW3]
MGVFEEKLARAERLEVICQRAGFALWQLQSLEASSAQAFVLMAKAKRGMGEKMGSKLLGSALKNTFGKTVHSMRRKGVISGELEQRFESILKERNWLVHRSRVDSEQAIVDTQAFEALHARIDQIAEESHSLMKALADMAVDFTLRSGVPKERIQIEERELLKRWHSRDDI